MILGKISLEPEWDIDDIEKSIKMYSMTYIKYFFQSRLKNKPELKKLKLIQNHLQNTYNIKEDIKTILLNILLNIKLNKNGSIQLRDFKLKDVKLSILYRDVTFGTLESPKTDIINEALVYAVRTVRLKKYYGN